MNGKSIGVIVLIVAVLLVIIGIRGSQNAIFPFLPNFGGIKQTPTILSTCESQCAGKTGQDYIKCIADCSSTTTPTGQPVPKPNPTTGKCPDGYAMVMGICHEIIPPK